MNENKIPTFTPKSTKISLRKFFNNQSKISPLNDINLAIKAALHGPFFTPTEGRTVGRQRCNVNVGICHVSDLQ